MRSEHRQADLFDKPAPAAPEPTLPLYAIAELDALYEQLRHFDRIPDAWCPGWHEMVNRAYATLRAVGQAERTHLRATFLAEARRLEQIDMAEYQAEQQAQAAAAAKAAEAAKAARRRKKVSA